MSGGQEVEGQEAGGQVLDGQGNKDQDESASLVSAAKRKRPLATNPQKHPAAKKVKSPSAGSKPPLASKSPSMRPPSMKQPRHMAKKQPKSSAAKQIRSAMVRTRSPVITGSPMMRFMVSPMMMRARTPPSRSPKARTQRSLSKSPAPQSPSNDHDNINNDIPCSARGSKKRKLRSSIWKEVEPIYESGKLVRGRCMHCNDVFPADRGSGTSHIRRHLELCEQRAKVRQMVDRLQSSTLPNEAATLADWTFDAEQSRGELVRMIVLHELPFSLVEYDGFIRYSASLNPLFKLVCRNTIKLDCMEVYKNHRSVLRDTFKNCNSRVSLTADTWTSKGNTGYMCITGHYIDDNWNVQKKIIRFCFIKTPHDAANMFSVMLKSLRYYGIEDKLFSITLDNAQANTSMVDLLMEHLFTRQLLNSGVDLFHVRCAAHVLNLIVKDGLQSIDGVLDNVRESVKYIRGSQSRKEKFEEIIAEKGISCKKRPSLDIPTRWNSTYLMLKSALPLSEAFLEFAKQDLNYKYSPSPKDWERSEIVCNLLKVFKRGTKVVSGIKYPTANLYFHQIWEVKQVLDEGELSANTTVRSMVREMVKKFDKYWKISYLSNCIPVILDPRFKFGFIEFRLRQAFGIHADDHINKVDRVITDLFNSYSYQIEDGSSYPHQETSSMSTSQGCPWSDWSHHLSVQNKQSTSELDRYLQDELFPCDEEDFDILHWWKLHSPKYPILATMARDILAVPASTVASESAFSTGSRIISEYRSSLSTDTVEALVCLQDWFRAAGSSYVDILSSANLDGADEDIDL